MKKIETVEEFKNIQLGILLQFHEFCVSHGINYSLSCGTLLGAIRHKGYIPWDDDIDVQLLRDDYNKLLEEFPAVYNNISLFSLERTSNWNRAYARAFDNRTLEREGVHGELVGIGIGIDVFPIDKVPYKENEWKEYNKRRMFWQNAYQLKLMRWSKSRGIIKNLIVSISQIALLPYSLRSMAVKIDSLSKKYNTTQSLFAYENCQGIGKRRNRFLLNDFSKYIDAEFEGYKLKIIQGYDDYLKNTYGEYMQLPPEEKRISTHTFEAYWK